MAVEDGQVKRTQDEPSQGFEYLFQRKECNSDELVVSKDGENGR